MSDEEMLYELSEQRLAVLQVQDEIIALQKDVFTLLTDVAEIKKRMKQFRMM